MNRTRPRNTLVYIFAIMIMAALPNLCASEPQDDEQSMRQDIEELKQDHAKILKELEAIKQLVAQNRGSKKATPFKPQDVSLKGIQFLGDNEAPVTLVEFTDYHCPFCRRHAKNTMPQILKNYVDTGKVRYGIREFPLESIHPQAFKLAQAGICGGQQGKYWTMHDLFLEKKVTDIDATAQAAGLNMEEFAACMADKATEQQVREDIKTATRLGVRGTPSFILGKTDSGNPDMLRALKFIRGAQPYSGFQAEIDGLLK